MENFIDSHAHLSGRDLFKSLDAIMQRAANAGLSKIINVCTDSASLKNGFLAQKKYSRKQPQLYLAAAATPHDVDAFGDSFFQEVKKAAIDKKLIAIGETGLDYHYKHSAIENQKTHLKKYLELADDTGLPLIFHVRDAFADFYSLVPNNVKGVLHCFTGNAEEAEKGLAKDLFISFSGIITFPKSTELIEVVKKVPLERILIETDTPYLSPQSKRGGKNEPAFIIETAQKLAEIKGVSLEKVAKVTSDNTKQLFDL